MTREPIYAALFALLAGAAGVHHGSRRLRHWCDVAAAEQPALFLAQKSETAELNAACRPNGPAPSTSMSIATRRTS